MRDRQMIDRLIHNLSYVSHNFDLNRETLQGLPSERGTRQNITLFPLLIKVVLEIVAM